MIATVLDEIAASAVAQLPQMITSVATIRGVVLDPAVNVVDWWKTDAEFLTVQYPALFLTWEKTTSRVRTPIQRQATHLISLGYVVRLANMVDIKRQLTYVPEAILAWLDDFPITSRVANKTIIAIAPKEDIEIQVDATKLQDGSLLWGVDLGPLSVLASDVASQLPARPITHP